MSPSLREHRRGLIPKIPGTTCRGWGEGPGQGPGAPWKITNGPVKTTCLGTVETTITLGIKTQFRDLA